MNDHAAALFSAFDDGVGFHARHAASLVRGVISAQALSPEQHQALEVTLRSELEAFTWFLLGRFDNVGCSLPESVLGYSILARASDPSEIGEHKHLPEVDIRENEEDYADMWQDHLADVRRSAE